MAQALTGDQGVTVVFPGDGLGAAHHKAPHQNGEQVLRAFFQKFFLQMGKMHGVHLYAPSMSLEDVFLELTDDSGKAARKLKKVEKEQLKQKEREKECEPEADKTAVGEVSEEKSTDIIILKEVY